VNFLSGHTMNFLINCVESQVPIVAENIFFISCAILRSIPNKLGGFTPFPPDLKILMLPSFS
ncbi:hypothetical protein L9F63_011803, partial [Diploptera punctata]